MKQIKLKRGERVASILAAGLELAEIYGYQNVTRDAIATRAGMSPALVTERVGTMPKLKRAIVGEAIRVKCLPVLAQAIVLRDPRIKNLDDDLKAKALASIR